MSVRCYSCLNYEDARLNKKIFDWSVKSEKSRCRNWRFMVKLNSLVLYTFIQLPFSGMHFSNTVSTVLMDRHIIE